MLPAQLDLPYRHQRGPARDFKSPPGNGFFGLGINGAELIAAGDYVDYDNAVAVKFQKAILTLPPKQQLAFNLRYYDEMSFEEISQVAGTTPSSVKVSYHVAKDKIIAYMNSND